MGSVYRGHTISEVHIRMVSKDYKYLLGENHFTEEEILSKAETLYKQCANFLAELKKTSKNVYIHEGKLEKLVCNYFVGIARLKEFHTDIENESPAKQAAYTAFWIMRCAPVQIMDNSVTELFPNELLAVSFLFTECKKAAGGALSKSQIEAIKNFGHEALYFFKFRHYNQQSIELALFAFLCGLEAAPTHPKTPQAHPPTAPARQA